jgi:murein DD-endopeptidase MepM/ murein hydrolase activator NlpD
VLATAAPAFAGPGRSGGAAYNAPEVDAVRCSTGDGSSCPRGTVLRLSGDNLAATKAVVFLGARGPGDDRRARPQTATRHRVLVTVPASARSGRVRVVAAAATAVGPRVRILAPAAARPAMPLLTSGTGVFPVRGPHSYGTAVNRFGGGRGHGGQDVLAACGTPLVAALAGEVTHRSVQGRAGNYVVVRADDGTSQAYMHLRAPATVTRGQRVAAGQPLGEVGRTGRASACHLHFELWTAPGWHAGGAAIDPLSLLRSWDAAG